MTIKIIGQIDEAAYKEFSDDFDAALKSSCKEINIELVSEGGDPDAALAFYGKIRTSNKIVVCTCHGYVQSAAIAILMACDERVATPETLFLVHDSRQSWKNKTVDELLCITDKMLAEELHWAKLLEDRTGTPASVWRQLSKKETYMKADEALQFGLLTMIMKGWD